MSVSVQVQCTKCKAKYWVKGTYDSDDGGSAHGLNNDSSWATAAEDDDTVCECGSTETTGEILDVSEDSDEPDFHIYPDDFDD